jgi:membrane associated rhomboid family serine protease
VFPIDDQEVSGAGPGYVTWGLVILNVLVFIFTLSLSRAGQEAFIQQFGVVPARILQGENLLSLITSLFLHGGFLHIIGNMLFLWVFGDNVEAILGHFGYLVFYLIGGLAANGAHILINPQSTLPTIGASGSVAAVLGAYLVMFPRSKVKALVFLGIFVTVTRVSALIFIGLWIGLQFLYGFASLGVQTAQSGGVAFFAHIGGFILGILAGFVFRRSDVRLNQV